MGIKHADSKTHGQIGYADEWNKDHVIDSDVDFNKHQLLQAVIEQRTDWPAGPVEGQIIYRSDEDKLYIWSGTDWEVYTGINIYELVLQGTSFPAAPDEGQMFYRTDEDKLYFYNGTSWIQVMRPPFLVVATDSSGDYTDIQDALDALPAGGGMIFVREGQYTENLTITTDNTLITGMGTATEIIGEIQTDADNITITKTKITGSSDHGIVIMTNGSNIKIINNTITANAKDGIEHSIWGGGNHADITIRGNIITGNGERGIDVADTIKAVIEGNFIYDNTGDGIRTSWVTEHAIITANSIEDNGGWGVNIEGGTCDRNLIHGNIILNNTSGEIQDTGSNTTAADNIIA